MLNKITLIALLSVSLLFGSCSNSIGPYDDTIASTIVSFALPESSHVKLWIENAYQTRVITLVDEERAAGSHTVTFELVDPKGNGHTFVNLAVRWTEFIYHDAKNRNLDDFTLRHVSISPQLEVSYSFH